MDVYTNDPTDNCDLEVNPQAQRFFGPAGIVLVEKVAAAIPNIYELLQNMPALNERIAHLQSLGILIRPSTVNPLATDGLNGDLWLNTTTYTMWGPKVAGAWPTTPFLLKGDRGNDGVGTNSGFGSLFTNMTGAIIGAGITSIRTAGRSEPGQHSAVYKLAGDQTANTVRGQDLINALPVGEQAAAQTAIRAILDRIRFMDSLGRYWIIDDTAQDVHAGHFGAVAGIGISYATGVVTGFNSQPAIQAMIDWRVYLNIQNPVNAKVCLLPAGDFAIDDGLQLSYGDNYATVSLVGAGRGRQGFGGGTSLYCRFNDRPAIAIQRGRFGGVYKMNIVSAEGEAYLGNNEFGAIEHWALIRHGKDERDLTVWHDHTKPTRSALLRYNPFCAIGIDPYAGPQIAAPIAWAINTNVAKGVYHTAGGNIYISTRNGTTAATGAGPTGETGRIDDGTVRWAYVAPVGTALNYPFAAAPAFLPTASRVGFNRGIGASNMNIEEVSISGFPVGIACQPCDHDGNADFLACRNVDIAYGAIPVSIGNTQARNNDFYRVNVNTYHTLMTNSMHGRQNGRADGQWLECSSSSGIQLFQLNTGGVTGLVLFQKFYAEILWRVGETVGAGGLAFPTVEFENCLLDTANHYTTNGARGIPNFMIGGEDSSYPPNFRVRFNGGLLAAFEGVAVFNVVHTQFNGFNIVSKDADGQITTGWRARALNTLAGGIVVPEFAVKSENLIYYQAQHETNLGSVYVRSTHRANRLTSRDLPASLFTPSFTPQYGEGTEEIINPNRIRANDWAAFSGVNLTGTTLTFSHPYTAAVNLASDNLIIGAVMWDRTSGMVFIIKTRVIGASSTTFTAELQNGYSRSVTGVVQYEKLFTTASSVWFAAGGVFTPNYPLFANCFDDSQVLSNCDRGDGYGGFIANNANSPIQVGDRVYADALIDGSTIQQLQVIGLSPATITLENTPYQSWIKRRFPLWLRGS